LEYFKSKNIKITYDEGTQGQVFDDDEEFTDSASDDEEEVAVIF